MVEIGQKIVRAARWSALKLGWVPVSSLSGNALFAKVMNHAPRNESLTLTCNSESMTFPVKAYHVNPTLYEHLGISTQLLKGGAEIQVASVDDFIRYGQLLVGENASLKGVYSPQGGKDVFAVMHARQLFMSRDARKVLVPSDVYAITLTHEILHDYFLNYNLGAASLERDFFIRAVVKDCYEALRFRPTSPAAVFYRAVAGRCSPEFDLVANVVDRDIPKMLGNRIGIVNLSNDGSSFIGEVFAYGGTMAIGYKEDNFGEVPRALIQYFKSRVVHPSFLSKNKVFTV